MAVDAGAVKEEQLPDGFMSGLSDDKKENMIYKS